MIDLKKKYFSKVSAKSWNSYLDKIGSYNRNHTYELLDFYNKLSRHCQNYSFICFDGKIPVAAVPLAIVKVKDKKIMSFQNQPLQLPALSIHSSPKMLRKINHFVYFEMLKIFKKQKVKYAMFEHSPLFINALAKDRKKTIDIYYKNSFSILRYFSLSTSTTNTNIINLSLNYETLKNNLNKEFRKEFKKNIYEELEFKVFNKDSSSEKIHIAFKEFKNLHFLSSKGKTREDSSWENMYQRIISGIATLFVLIDKKNNKIISALFCSEFKNLSVHAGSQASALNDYKNYSLRHFLEWAAIKYYKEKNFSHYEVGRSYFFDDDWNTSSEKLKDIGKLKLRFGGDLFPLHYFKIDNNSKNIFDE